MYILMPIINMFRNNECVTTHDVCYYIAHENSMGETRRRSRHQNNSRRVVRNLEKRRRARRGKVSKKA